MPSYYIGDSFSLSFLWKGDETMDITTWEIILAIVGLFVTLVLGMAALYQGSIPKRSTPNQPLGHTHSTKPLANKVCSTQILQNSSEISHIPPFWEAVLQVIFFMALATASLFFAIEYLFIPFVIWLYHDANGWIYILGFSALLSFVGTVSILVWKARNNGQRLF
jgi:hypothetical protein